MIFLYLLPGWRQADIDEAGDPKRKRATPIAEREIGRTVRPRPANLGQDVIGFTLTGWPWWIHITSTFATLISWTLVLAIGFSASDRWPHSGALGNFERFIIFLAGSFITRATVTNHETRVQLSCWAASAVIVEVARRSVSGRSNGIKGWFASMLGAVIGAVSARHIAHHDFWRWGW